MLSGAARGAWFAGWPRRLLAGALAAAAVPAAVLGGAGPAHADAVRQQEMWVLDALHAPAAWSLTQGHGVTVAVIDSGVNPAVSDLAGSVHTGPDLTGVHTGRSNPHWGVHGTWMASLIGGHGHAGGGSGIIGIAPQAKILSVRVVTDQGDPGFGRYERESAGSIQRALARAINYATDHKVAVISMSLGYGASSGPVRAAIQHAVDAGVVVVASSGNSGDSASARRHRHAPYSFPANYPGVLGVGAVSQSGAPANFSSNNLSVEVAAPGVKVPAQGRDGQYWLVSGTSPACALTAGVAALIKSRYRKLPPALVELAITASAQNPPPGGYDDKVGFGTVDAAAALALAGRLAHDTSTGRGLATAAHFGGGPAAVPAVPIPPRDRRQLLLCAVLAFACLLLAIAVIMRLAGTRRRARATRG
jgi:subtilisin family serine protease